MSDNIPPGDPNQPGPTGPYTPPGQQGRGPVEFLQAGQGQPLAPAPRRGRGRRIAVVGGTVLTLGLVAGGVWAWNAYFNQGPQPSEALPAGTLAYASIDLDPSGEQKVEAIKFLRKFPAFKDEIGLDTDDDVRKEIFTRIQDEGACEDLDYADDVEPWLGDRLAFAAVDRGDESPAPVLVVQIKDEDKAADGLEKLVECGSKVAGESDDIGGYAFNGGWVVLAETEEIAKDVVKDTGDKTLAGDSDYKKWTEAAGDPGIVTLYAAPEAGEAMLEFLDDTPFLFGGSEDYAYGGSGTDAVPPPEPADPQSDFPTAAPSVSPGEIPSDWESDLATKLPSDFETQPVQPDVQPEPGDESSQGEYSEFSEEPDVETDGEQVPDELRRTFEDFPGGAGTIRFHDGDLEMEFATGEIPGSWSSLLGSDRGADVLNTLPDTTAAALGVGFEEGWVDELIEQLAPMIEDAGGMSVDDAIESFEGETGLSVPEDIEALGGESFAIAFDSGFDTSAFEEEDLTRVPVGAKIKGDPDKIEAALDKIRAAAGPDGDLLLSRTEDRYVLVSGSEDYLDQLAGAGDLGDSSTLKELVPEAGDASAIVFVNFDAGDGWLDELVKSMDAPDDVVENVKPLKALGISSWKDGDESHSLVKLTTN